MEHEEFQIKVIDSLARLETHMDSLVGNGQPGRVTKLEIAVAKLIRFKYFLFGAAIAISTLIHFLFKY